MRPWILRSAPPVIYGFMRLLESTIRWVELNPQPARSLWAGGGRVILVFWHNRMLMAPFFYRGRGLKILISRHADGELIARVMARFDFGTVRGSTRRRGVEAFRDLLRSVEQGWDIVITPDGPRGPRYQVQAGVIELARRTGLAVLPVTYSTAHRFECPSWDGFVIPRPFTRGVFIWGSPQFISGGAGGPEREAARVRLEATLRRMTDWADGFFTPPHAGGSR